LTLGAELGRGLDTPDGFKLGAELGKEFGIIEGFELGAELGREAAIFVGFELGLELGWSACKARISSNIETDSSRLAFSIVSSSITCGTVPLSTLENKAVAPSIVFSRPTSLPRIWLCMISC